jgi:hypothetical protein
VEKIESLLQTLVRDQSNVDAVATKYRVLIIEAKKNPHKAG